MRSMRTVCLALMTSLALASLTRAQPPAIPGAPAAPAAAGGAPAPAAPSANIFSMICPTAEQKQACKNCFCNSAIGKLISGGGGPMSLISGGLIQNRCAQNSLANDLKKSAESPEGAAAKVKADEADAKARVAAVRYLANVDCERWPEATETLKNALRKDRNECVRLEAALALRNGCCCNNETIDALKNCVLGEQKTDPNPVERSERVRLVAAEALARCCAIPQPIEDPRDRMQKTEAPPYGNPADYYKTIASMPRDQVVAGARAALVSLQKPVNAQTAGQATSNAAPGPMGVAFVGVNVPNPARGNLSGIVNNAFAPGGVETRQPFFTGLTKSLTGKQDSPDGAPALSYDDLVTRVRSQAASALDANYSNAWADLELAAQHLEQSARLLPRTTHVPEAFKSRVEPEANLLRQDAVRLMEAARARNAAGADEAMQRIHQRIRQFRS